MAVRFFLKAISHPIPRSSRRRRRFVLLCGYQHGEELQTQLQQREPVSFQFLWEALGLPPE
jgi:hypothetical protein